MYSVRSVYGLVFVGIMSAGQFVAASPDIDDACTIASQVVDRAVEKQQIAENKEALKQIFDGLQKISELQESLEKSNPSNLEKIKAYILQQGGSFKEYARNHPYAVAGIAAVVTCGGFSFYLYKNGYLQPITRAVDQILAAICGLKKAVTFVGTTALVGGIGALLAYKYGYITDSHLIRVQDQIAQRSDVAVTYAKKCALYVAHKAGMVKDVVKNGMNRVKGAVVY